MGADVVIRAEGLSKKYVIGHQAERERYVALRDVITRNVRALGRTALDLVRGRPNVAGDDVEDFWALRDVSFEVQRGEVVGVIGRNGAGKSTLLKILSRITEPTEGRVEIRGRVASLLEVGTGFHPELTGRENIYLNGAVLGMSRAEIRRKFDEIVAFAEVERFLDTPVKRYSSGMYVRLAFAVAAHLEPEILIVDEVLAVGDAEFQKKCLGKIGEVARQGRTVIFVSHQLDAISRLCGRAILLRDGRVTENGEAGAVIRVYQADKSDGSGTVTASIACADVMVRLLAANFVPNGMSILTVAIEINQDLSISEACIIFYSLTEQRVALVDLRSSSGNLLFLANDPKIFDISLEHFNIIPGEYKLNIWMVSNCGQKEITFSYVEVHASHETKRLSPYPERLNGVIRTYGSVRVRA